MNKQQILNEIKRTAKANGGVPVGWRRFFTETGIKESNWKGVFWARWSDAIREAGFRPNEKITAFDDATLIEKFISLMRELGHYPVSAELQLKARNDESFPSDTPYRRFGSKKEFASKIVDYCNGRTGYDDVISLCEAISETQSVPSDDDKCPGDEIGFVYLIKSGRHYKIGRSVSVGQRERQLAIQLPQKADTIHSIRTDDPVGIEAYWHKRFESKRKNGEWFELDRADVSAFKRRKFM